MALKTTKFDPAEYLKTPEDIRDFLTDAYGAGSDHDFIKALGIAARAKGMTDVASEAGVSRESLYRALSDEGNPSFSTVYRVMKALGVKLAIAA